MAKAYLNMDSVYQYFLWDLETLSILDKDKYLELTEMPQELIDEYNDLINKMATVQETLGKLFYEKTKSKLPVY